MAAEYVLCANCQKEFGLELVAGGGTISHGICKRHAMEMLKSAGMDAAAQKFAEKFPGKDPLDLSDPEQLTRTKEKFSAFLSKKA